ncbi:MAG: GNAT family N-acetyltransferase [Peptostreptococcaceae bacterium]|nr:GNAT family N-acetyltransferase [Peptostreptococcaceae bacterium]
MRTLETKRLIMRAWSMEDAKSLYEYAKHPDVGPHAGWKPHADIEESKEVLRDILLPVEAWAVIYKETGEIIGNIALENDRIRPDLLSKELGYGLKHEWWGKGIITEASKEVIRYGFEDLKLEVIAIHTSEVNKRSQRVIEKCGFKYEGLLRNSCRIFTGEKRNSYVFSLLAEEWEK